MRTYAFSLLLAAALVACNGSDAGSGTPAPVDAPVEAGGSAPAAGTAKSPKAQQVDALRAHIEELQAKPEHGASKVTVRHILIGFKGAPRMTVSRKKADAERLAASLFARIEAGEDFAQLVKEFSDDPGEGLYTMTGSGVVAPTAMGRNQMVPAFGDVGWRLEVGEVGVAPHHAKKSPYGWHIVKRVK